MNTRTYPYLLACLLGSLLIICGLLLVPTGSIQGQAASSPYLVASYQHNVIEFEGFAPYTNLSFEIYSSPGGDLLHAETLITDADGHAFWRGWQYSFDIAVGQHIIASDGATTKDLLLADVRYDVLDIVADQARGIAPAGTQVDVYVYDSYHELSTVTGSSGVWVADFAADGQDVQSYESTAAHILDADGDATVAFEPSLTVSNVYDSRIEGHNFTSGGNLSVEIYDAAGGTLLYSASDIVARSDDGYFEIGIWQHGQNLQPGTQIVVTDQTSGEDRELTLQPFTMDLFDYEQEFIAGTAPAGLTINVSVPSINDFDEIYVVVGSDNTWSVDFTTVGVDLNPSDDIRVELLDLDSDSIRTAMLGPLASTTEDFVHWSWHGAPLTAAIYDPSGNKVFGPEVFSEIDSMGIDTLDYGIDLAPGYQVDVDYGGGRVIGLVLADLSLDDVNRDADQVTGTAPPGSTVSVIIWDKCGAYFAGYWVRADMDVAVNSSGFWEADFSAQGFDITHQHSAAVFLREFDGGVSAVGEPQYPFNIDAFPDGPGIHILGDFLTPDSTVILAVYEFEDGPLIFEEMLTVSSAGDAWWDGWDGDIYLYPGTYIKATDENSGWVETLTVIDVTYEAVDVENDIAQGHALPGTEFGVDFYFRETLTTPYVAEKLIVTAGEDGYWLADFGAAGIDIPPYAFHGVHINDGDGDMTIDNLPHISASEDNWIWIHSFTPDSAVTVEIYDEPDGALIYGPYTLQTNPAGRALFSAATYDADLQPGYYSVVTDEMTGFAKTHELESVNLQVDVDTDLVFGNSKPGAWIRANPQGARALFTIANEYGEWVADFGAIGVDLTDDGYIDVDVYDEDNDYTWESWPPPYQPPSIDAIGGPVEPVAVNTEVQVSADFTDPDDGDAHTALWDWGDGTSSAGTVDEDNHTVSGSHTYLEAGIYSLTLTVTDAGGASDTAIFEYIVVYDPKGGFVTGGGWIYSAVGWCQLDDVCAGAEGTANFGFVSKYKKGASVPTGNTEFNFKAGGLNFHSSSYDWLVVNQGGANAQYKGSGTINGEGDYKFMLWAGDDEPDTFRIRIWEEDEVGNETVVYDNGFNQAIGGGNIVVHTGQK